MPLCALHDDHACVLHDEHAYDLDDVHVYVRGHVCDDDP